MTLLKDLIKLPEEKNLDLDYLIEEFGIGEAEDQRLIREGFNSAHTSIGDISVELDAKKIEGIIAQEIAKWEVAPKGRCIQMKNIAQHLADNMDKIIKEKE